jgi:hypothetical protein
VARHPFDPLSLVFGLLFATAGLIVLLGGSLTEEGAFLAPTALIALGLALLYQARRHRDVPAQAPLSATEPETPTAPEPDTLATLNPHLTASEDEDRPE